MTGEHSNPLCAGDHAAWLGVCDYEWCECSCHRAPREASA